MTPALASVAVSIRWLGAHNELVDDRTSACGGFKLSGRCPSHAGRTRTVQRRACSDDETSCGTGLAGFVEIAAQVLLKQRLARGARRLTLALDVRAQEELWVRP